MGATLQLKSLLKKYILLAHIQIIFNIFLPFMTKIRTL